MCFYCCYQDFTHVHRIEYNGTWIRMVSVLDGMNRSYNVVALLGFIFNKVIVIWVYLGTVFRI